MEFLAAINVTLMTPGGSNQGRGGQVVGLYGSTSPCEWIGFLYSKIFVWAALRGQGTDVATSMLG
jgi:hypothetical protein